MSEEPQVQPVKKAKGWPKGKPRGPRLRPPEPAPVERKPLRADLHAEPVWADTVDPMAGDDSSVNPLQFPPWLIERLPKDMSYLWMRVSSNGQPDLVNRQNRLQKGRWEPVYPHYFGGIFDGIWAPKGDTNEITFDGSMVLVARHKAITDRARAEEYRKAREQVAVKERQFTGGGLEGVSLDATHPSAVKSNRISKSFERIDVPKD